MFLPPPLSRGDTIGVFSPSYPLTAIAPADAERAIRFLEDAGFRVRRGLLTGRRDFYRSGTIAERAEEINELIRDPEVRCLMATVGGFVTNALLPHIDFGALRRDPKVIVGHSDVTALLLAAYAKTGLQTYYGPNLVTTFGQLPPYLDLPLACFLAVAGGARPYEYPFPAQYSDHTTEWEKGAVEGLLIPNGWKTVSGGRAAGRLMGGNLNTLNAIMGSPYMPEFREGDILFVEDTEKWAAYCERYFSTLKISGVFDRIGGMILGKHRRFDAQGSERSNTDILLEVLGEPRFPILADFDCCHTLPILTLPIGAEIELDADKKSVRLV